MNPIYIFIGIVIVVIVYRFLKRKARENSRVEIENPKILILSFDADSIGEKLAEGDVKIYSDTYANVDQKVIQSISELKELVNENIYDLYHLVIDVSNEGNIMDSANDTMKVGDLITEIQKGRGSHLIFAKENESTSYENGTKNINCSINMVMTMDRKGIDFETFFKSLFEKVQSGETMPLAWNDIAPQNPHADHKKFPECLCIPGAANVILR